MTSNQKKAELLGMPFGTANGKLRKSLLFSLAQQLKVDICFRCKEKIETEVEFSIEHKQAWASSKVPKEAFFDLSNIAFSHPVCNIRAAYRSKKYLTEEAKRNAHADQERLRWSTLSQEEQQKIRRDKYLRNNK